jgi:hypothetical protein
MNLEVFVPTGSAPDSNKYPYAPRLASLNGKTIGEISNRLWAADRIFPVIRDLLCQRFPGIRFLPYTDFPSGSDKIMDDENLGELVLANGCDAVIGASAG